ncbi:hypothetical protein RND81_14G119200 [Saponaria officinalis]|uniref:RBR-type E3 ubiquitin transferase n=1 Tax=Saponaria officinalis TaxID=3572 RepID=A0AAW1GRJ9_SAPOF
MGESGKFLQKLPRHFSQEKFNSSFSQFHHSQPIYDNLHENDAFADDWELIELLDQDFAAEGDGNVIESFNLHDKTKYRIRSQDDVHRHLEDKVTRVCTVYSLSRSEAVILLNHFNWRVSRLHEEWPTCEEKVRKVVGLFEKPVEETCNTNEIACSLCCENREADSMVAISCGHQRCLSCWTEYISEAINDGPECLTLRCPEGSCEAAVGIELIELVSNEDDKKKFHDYRLQSFITGRRKAKWCPAQDCEYAVFASFGEDANNDVTCKCLHSFCWNCSKEAHAPVDCVRVGEWLSEMDAQKNWVLAKARPCPNCKKLIEETSCKMYLRCTLCDYMFPSDAFSEGAPDKEDTKPSDDDNDCSKSSSERLEQYYSGWLISEGSRVNAVTELKVLKEIRLEILCFNLNLQPTELGFLVEAQMQVIECWRSLKWMHVCGYYVAEDEQKSKLFEFILEQAEKLVRMMEKHVDEFVNGVLAYETVSTQYIAGRSNIIQLNRVAGEYYGRLVEAMKSDLCAVVSLTTTISSSSSSSPPKKAPEKQHEDCCSSSPPEKAPEKQPEDCCTSSPPEKAPEKQPEDCCSSCPPEKAPGRV